MPLSLVSISKQAHLGFGAYAMRYNVFDLYEGSVRGDKLKEVALKLDYAKPAKGQGVNGNNEEIDEAKLLSGLNPSILSLLKFEVKFKNMDNAPISELIQDVDFKNAIFNVAVNAARLEKLFTELKQLHYKEQEIEKAVVELKHLIDKEKQTEKEQKQQDFALRQLIEAQNQALQRMINDYIRQRAEKIRALEDTIKELNVRQKELIAYDKEILKEYSNLYAATLDSAVNTKGEPILRNMSPEDRKIYALNVNDNFYNIDKKYDEKIQQNNQRIAEIDKELVALQNGATKSGFDKNSGLVNPAFQRHTGKSSPQILALQRERDTLSQENQQYNVQRKDEKRKAVIKHAKAGGVDVTKDDSEILVEHASNDKKNKEMYALRNTVRDELTVVNEKSKVAHQELDVVQKGFESTNEVIQSVQSETTHEVDYRLKNTELIEEENKEIATIASELVDEIEIDEDLEMEFDLEGIDLGLEESIELSSEFLSSENDEPSASVRTKLN